MKRFSKRLEKLEAALNPRGKRGRSDEEEEKWFLEGIKRIKSLTGVTEGDVKVCLKLFEIEKEQAKREKRRLETWWNVMWLAAVDPLDYQARQKVKLKHPGLPLSKEHRERVKELFLKVGHPLGKTM